ncbi:DUF1579 domain-containing protein [Sphingomonas asaccharolytica]|uniref:DUF1579 domain-containing protein n=1 Tax=Sphingomonas asaccharolytica TaxID=40681 RepID=UPI000A8F833D|nr:DUF1579 domain-containing protein [Sphingomonas asaccharolytica]
MDTNKELNRRKSLALAAALPLAAAWQPALAAGGRFDQQRGFDFLIGEWRVRHRKLRKRLAGNHEWFDFPGTLSVSPILNGAGNFDRNELSDPSGPYEAHSLRLFSTATGHWSIWWLDGRAPALDPPVVGRFEGKRGTFFADDVFAGRPIRVRTTYEPLSPTIAQWTQAFSDDGERSWETNWIMDFTRAKQ